MGKRIILTFLLLYTGALLLNAIGFSSWLPSCLFTEFTGIHCLGCGMNRAAISLLQGDITSALQVNPLIFLFGPLLLVAIVFIIRSQQKIQNYG